MKWIGQHIWDFISRFRSDVYLEDLSTTTESNVLVVDSDGKVSKNTSMGGDITGVSLASDSGTVSDTAGSADFTIAGGNAINTSATGSTVTVNHDDTSSQASVDNSGRTFIQDITLDTYGHVTGITSATDADTYEGDITGVRLTADDTNTASDAAGSADFTIAGGEGIDTSVSGTTLTIAGEDASATNKGVVELATTAEADSGTDTDRAITAAGLKSHVDARYHYQYIHFLGNATVPADGDWMTISGNGISNHTWNTNLGSGGVTVGSSTATIPLAAIGAGIRIPYAAVLVGFTGIFLRASNHQPAAGLLLGEPTWNDYATFDCTLRAYAAADYSAGPDSNYNSRPIKAEDLTRSQAISAGQVIYPVVKDLGSSASVCKLSMTIVIKTLIP